VIMTPLEQAKYEMIEAGGRTAQSFGLNALLGRMYMMLYLKREAVCLDDVAAELGVSKASASIAGRQLQAWGAVKRVWQKGDRRDFYAAETSLKAVLGGGLLDMVEKKLQSAQVQIDRCRSVMEGSVNGEEAAFVASRLDEAETMRRRVQSLMRNKVVRALLK